MNFSFSRSQNDVMKRNKTLSSALNTILTEFRDKEYGHLPTPSRQAAGEELIFMSNYQAFVESNHIANHASSSKRRPDIIATFTSTLRKHYTSGHKSKFEDWVRLASDGWFNDLLTRKGRWIDVQLAWEIEPSHRNDTDQHEEVSKAQGSTPPPMNTRKRQSDESLSGDKKRVRVSEQTNGTKPFHTLDKQRNLIPDLRCAYYALERLYAASTVTHSMAVLLEGESGLSHVIYI